MYNRKKDIFKGIVFLILLIIGMNTVSAQVFKSIPFQFSQECKNIKATISNSTSIFYIPISQGMARSQCFNAGNAYYYILYSQEKSGKNDAIQFAKSLIIENTQVVFQKNNLPFAIKKHIDFIIQKYIKKSQDSNISLQKFKQIFKNILNVYKENPSNLTQKEREILLYFDNRIQNLPWWGGSVAIKYPPVSANPVSVNPISVRPVSVRPLSTHKWWNPGEKIFLTQYHSPQNSGLSKTWYGANMLISQLYPEYNTVIESKNEWNILNSDRKKKSLYWDGLQLKDYKNNIIDDVSQRIYDSKEDSTIFEWHVTDHSSSYTAFIPIAIEKPLNYHGRSYYREWISKHYIKKSAIYSQRFRAPNVHHIMSSPRNSSPTNAEDLWRKKSGSLKKYVAKNQLTKYSKKYAVTKKSEISISKIPWDFSFETSCRSENITLSEVRIDVKKDNNVENCYLNIWEMYYFNSRAIEIDKNNNILEASTCGVSEYCVISMWADNAATFNYKTGQYIWNSKRFPVFDIKKNLSK